MESNKDIDRGKEPVLVVDDDQRVGEVLGELLSALDFAHSKGYVHRDVKPSNLLVLGPTGVGNYVKHSLM